MLKEGDFVKVKPGTRLETGELVNDWVVEIEEIFEEDQYYLVTLDAPSINSLTDTFIRGAMEEGADPFQYAFKFDDVLLAPRRDTEEEFRAAMEELEDRVMKLEEVMEEEQAQLREQWIAAFEKSDFHAALSALQQAHSSIITNSFLEFMHYYGAHNTVDWTPKFVKDICLNVIPTHLVAEAEVFEHYGEVLLYFLKFLANKHYAPEAESYTETIEEIKNKMPTKAANTKNWSRHKSVSMRAQRAGIDLMDEAGQKGVLQLMEELDGPMASRADFRNFSDISIKGIGRNEKITVKYRDGRVVEDIKFKKVKNDLESKDCIIIKR